MTANRLVASWSIVAISMLLWANFAQSATRNYDIGDRLTAASVWATDGTTQLITFERPSIIVLWAAWSPGSLTALGEIIKGAPQGGIRWQIIPINCDAPSLNSNDTARVHSVARTAGWHSPVLYDRGFELMDAWGVLANPTVVFTGLGGAIEEIEHDWSPVIRDRLFTIYFGAITDSFPGITTPITSAKCRSEAETARRLWRMGKKAGARKILEGAVDSCAGLSSDVARLANWVFSMGDSLKGREDVTRMLGSAYKSAWTNCASASLCSRRGACDSAIALCEEALREDSAFFPAWMLMAECKWRVGDTAGSIAAYERARALNRLDARVTNHGAAIAAARGELTDAARLIRLAVETRLRQRLR